MEFNRGTQPSAGARPAHTAEAPASGGAGKSKAFKGSPKWLRVMWIVLLFGVTVVLALTLCLMYFGGNKSESEFVDKKKQQAVFLTNGQVYFGKISSVNKQYIDLRGIYYLNVNQQVQPNQKDQQQQSNVTLVKLGCELHGPVDQMLINRDQVTFWENLKTDGQVAKAVDEWVKQNPNGQQCQTASNTTDTTQTTKP